jgi:hypothetical protein
MKKLLIILNFACAVIAATSVNVDDAKSDATACLIILGMMSWVVVSGLMLGRYITELEHKEEIRKREKAAYHRRQAQK